MITPDELHRHKTDINKVHFSVNAALRLSNVFNRNEYEDSLLWWMEESPLHHMMLSLKILSNLPGETPEFIASEPVWALDDSLRYAITYLANPRIVVIGCSFMVGSQGLKSITYTYDFEQRAITRLRVVSFEENDVGRQIMLNLRDTIGSSRGGVYKFEFES